VCFRASGIGFQPMNHRQDADATAKAKMRSNAQRQRPTPNIELKNEGARN
jgi:hypothetical protein